MTTLIEVRHKGRCVGRCDAKCYDAQHDDCSCVCGGRNHGKGHDKASENVRNHSEDMVTDYVALLEIGDYETLINLTVVNQLRLPLNYRLRKTG